MKITTFHSFEEIKPFWIEFEKEAELYAFQTYDWLSHWYKSTGVFLDEKPCFVKIENDMGKPLILLPLGIRKRLGVSCLSWLGGELADYNAPILCRNVSKYISYDQIRDLWKQIINRLSPIDAVYFDKQPEQVGDQTNPFIYLNCNDFPQSSYSINLEGDWKTFYQNIKKNIRTDSQRQRRRLAKLGVLKFIIGKDEDDIRLITNKMIEQKSRRYKETGSSNPFNKQMYQHFYHSIGKECSDSGLVHVSALLLNDTIIATHWGLVYKGRFYYLLPTYAGEEWKRYSAGRILLEHLFEWCFEKKINVFDFSVGDEPYKKDWCNKTMKLYEYRESLTVKGKNYLYLPALKNWVLLHPPVHNFIKKNLGFFRSYLAKS